MRPRFMCKLSARDIQVFVAGALAYLGFDALIQMPFAFLNSEGNLAFADIAGGSIGIVLAVGIIAGSMRALRWLQIYLWISLLVDVVTICVLVSGISNVWHIGLHTVTSGFLTVSALLCLITWSRSKQFRAGVA